MPLRDQQLVCVACGGDFVWTIKEQLAYRRLGLPRPLLGPRCRSFLSTGEADALAPSFDGWYGNESKVSQPIEWQA